MKIIKRDGKEVSFDSGKIFIAIQKANKAGTGTPELANKGVANVTSA
ncbi:ATP cone domain-containing protein, partial [uncultured Dubosiella sp.]